MDFETNAERTAYLDARGKVVLNACPGSGKTTVIAQKLRLSSSSGNALYGKFLGIACLSFTNTAKDEILRKYKELSGSSVRYPNLVSTIDSFINQHITLPFYYLIENENARPKIVEDSKFLNDVWLAKYRYKDRKGQPFCFRYPPDTIQFELNDKYSSNGTTPASNDVDPGVFHNYCKAIKNWQIKNGLITTGDSAFIALALLRRFPNIGTWLCHRFPYMIVDEAQDNSEVQHLIFDELLGHGLQHLELVGDPYQTLYEWRDAKPQLFLDKYKDKDNWAGLNLTNNRRSSQRIIDAFSIIRSPSDPKITSNVAKDLSIPITIYRYSEENVSTVVKHFDNLSAGYGLTDSCHIVVRGNALKNKLLGKAADQEPWKTSVPYTLIDVQHLLEFGDVKSAINLMRRLRIEMLNPGLEHKQLMDLIQSAKNDHRINSSLQDFILQIPSQSLTIKEWTERTQTILKTELNLGAEPNFELKKKSSKYFNKTILNDSVDTHFKRSFTSNQIPITTIHQVKGKSIDSVLVVFNEQKHKENITFADIDNKANQFPSEKQRLIYVAMSRAAHFLALAFPESISDQQIETKFGANVSLVDTRDLI